MKHQASTLSLYRYSAILGMALIKELTPTKLFYIVMDKSNSETLLIDFVQSCAVEVQNEQDLQMLSKLGINKVSLSPTGSKQIDENLTISDLQISVGIQCLLPYNVQDKLQLIQESVIIDDEYFKVNMGEFFLYDIDVLQKDDSCLSMLFGGYFTQPRSVQLFRQNLSTPLWSYHTLQKRLLLLRQMNQTLYSSHLKEIRKHLKQVKSFQPVFGTFKRYENNVICWKRFINSLEHIRKIVAILRDFEVLPDSLQPIANIDDDLVERLIELVRRTMDLDDGCRIYSESHKELKRLRGIQANIDGILSTSLSEWLESVEVEGSPSFSLATVQNLGYLVKVSGTYSNLNTSGWELCIQESDDLYYRNQFTQDLYSVYGDIDNDIRLLEGKIIMQVMKQVLYFQTNLSEIEDLICALDYNTTICTLMETFNLTLPILTLEQGGRILGGRNLISEQFNKNTFIPNDFNWSAFTILSGPNYSGKSVYIKQVALITYMAHVGLPVPAKSAVIPLVDGMYSLFAGEGSKDLKTLSKICKFATTRSLIIIDELGKDFKYDIGSALFSSTIEYFRKHLHPSRIRDCDNILVMLATHYYNVIERDFVGNGNEDLQILQMKVDANMEFKYLVSRERSQRSLALEVAANVLNDQYFLQRGQQILQQIVERRIRQ